MQGTLDDLADYCEDLLASSNEYYGTHRRVNLLEELANPSRDTHRWLVGLRIFLARDYLRTGETREAVRLLLEALDAEERSATAQQFLPEILETMAVTYLKMGELDLYSCNESMYRDASGELRPMYEDTTGAARGRLRSQLFVYEDPSGSARGIFPSQLFRNRG